MKAIRRSIKGEKHESKPHHISITPKSAVAILPPKKVIKALHDYTPEPGNSQELRFVKGDFFHVVGQENNLDWYDACNPLIPGARGLVPVSYFEVIGKTERQSAGSTTSGSSNTLPDSGYSTASNHTRQDSTATARTLGHTRVSSMSKGAMVYGIVIHDFVAERPDELEAKAGEAIIVIAQSNAEWFVAKPIGRLGGPGLIPVTFIEVRDMTTGQAVPDVQRAVQQAGVPKVEEWKKMAAEYKKSSITLGKFETGNAAQAQLRESMRHGDPAYAANGNGYVHTQSYQQIDRQQNQGRNSQSNLLAPVSASIPRYCFENDKYWYIIECVMEDGNHWELSRYYQNFYDFQIALLQEFPREAATDGGTRILPFMPGPVTYVTDAISNGRRESLNEYVKKLLSLPPYISRCHLVRQLFAPRAGDFELDPHAMGEDYRLSSTSQQSSIANTLSRTASRQSSHGQMNGGASAIYGAQPPSHQWSHPAAHSASVTSQPHYRTPSTDPQHPVHRQPSSLTQTSTPPSLPHNTSTTNVSASGALKIKVFFDDDLIAIRVPQDIGFAALRDKLKERLKIMGGINIQYKDEPSTEYAALRGDADLDVARKRNPKLTLYVVAVEG